MDIYNIIAEIANNPQRSVLVTTIKVEGHAYRKEGAMMLMKEDGMTIGTISPGCMEVDLMERVPNILLKNESLLVEYDMQDEDDFSWGEAIGCGGKLQVLLEPVSNNLLEHMLEIKRKLDQGKEVHFIRLFDNDGLHVKYKLFPFSKSLAELRNIPGFDTKPRMFQMTFSPKPRLIIFGAGNDSRPIAELASKLDFHIVVVDWRVLLCTKERFGDAEFVIGFPNKILKQLHLNDKDYVIVMSHHLRWDREFLQGLSKIRVKYVGVMGSRTRCEKLLTDITAPEWFHAPVGLRIGADGPGEIAISILAELIHVRASCAQANARSGDGMHAAKYSRDLFGSGKEQADGVAQAFHHALEG
jgi:xanthine dehydrogenase accessory factor